MLFQNISTYCAEIKMFTAIWQLNQGRYLISYNSKDKTRYNVKEIVSLHKMIYRIGYEIKFALVEIGYVVPTKGFPL